MSEYGEELRGMQNKEDDSYCDQLDKELKSTRAYVAINQMNSGIKSAQLSNRQQDLNIE